MIISYSKRFVFQHIEKAGGTTVEHSLKPFLVDGDLLINDRTRILFYQDDYPLSEHAPFWLAEMWVGDSIKNYKRFATVRNPQDIMKSMYVYAMRVYEDYQRAGVPLEDGALTAVRYAELSGYGIDGFIDYMFSRGYHCVSPQVDRLGNMIGTGRIIDLTQLDEQWESITKWLGYQSIPMIRKNVSDPYEISLSSQSIEKIRNNFYKDYEILPEITGVSWR